MLAHLLQRSNVKDASVRFRSSQIIAETMGVLPEDVDIEYVFFQYTFKSCFSHMVIVMTYGQN